MSEAHLIRDNRWGNVPELVYSAIEADLRTRRFAEPHGDAYISQLDMRYDRCGLHAVVGIAVTVYPSRDEVQSFYESGWKGVIAPPAPRILYYTLEVDL